MVGRAACPECGSKDNVSVYGPDDYWCETPGCTYKKSPRMKEQMISGQIVDLFGRKISKDICEFLNYTTGHYKGTINNEPYDGNVHIANYYNSDGQIAGQKLRTPDKKFKWLGSIPSQFYGQQKWPNPSNKVSITIVEGEIDTLTLLEAQGTAYPVVSSPVTNSLKKYVENNYQWLSGWKNVVIALDNDEAGKAAVDSVKDMFEPGMLKICTWSKKDPNQMWVEALKEGKTREQAYKEIQQCLWNAQVVRPTQMVTVEDILDEIKKRPERGEDFPWPTMTEITYGRRPGEIYIIVGATSIGKTEIVKEIMFKLMDENINVALFSFEQDPASTFKRMAGSKLQRKLHIPSDWWDEDLVGSTAMGFNRKLFCYNNKQSPSFNDIVGNIRYTVKCHDVGLVVIDNLKALQSMAQGKNQVEHLTQCMLTFQALARELQITVILLSHISKAPMQLQTYVSTSPKNPEEYLNRTSEDMDKFINKPGMSWESGRMPTREHVEGAGAICDLADYVFAAARDTTNEDPDIQRTTRIKCLKDRMAGAKVGHIFKLYYGDDGILREIDNNDKSGMLV